MSNHRTSSIGSAAPTRNTVPTGNAAPTRHTGGARRNFARAAAAILLGLTLSSCSFGPTLEKDESARAIFDAENDRVILPLDAYDTTGKDEYFTKALELARKKCFAEHGQHYKMFVRTEGSGRNFGRTYGIWNVEYAKKYGLHKSEDSNTLDLSSPAPSSDPGKDVSTECYQRASDEMKQIGEIPFGSATYRRVENDVRNAAGDRQLKKSLDDEWKRCVKNKGLTPDSEMTVKESKNIPQSNTPSEEEIRIAVIEAQCNQDVGRSQKLYDLEAQYQKPLIAKNQAALENELKEFKRKDEQFKQYVLDNQ